MIPCNFKFNFTCFWYIESSNFRTGNNVLLTEHRIPVVVPKDEVLSDDSLALHEKGQNGVSSTSNGSEAIYVPENGAAKPKNIVWGKVPLKYVLESDESPL